MEDAVDQLRDTIEDLGPFDGVFAFSQGAATLIAMLYQLQSAHEPAPIGFAVICSSAMPCAADLIIGQDVVDELYTQQLDVADAEASRTPSLSSAAKKFVVALQKTIVPAWKAWSLMPRFELEVYNEEGGQTAPRVMIPAILREKIRLPTVHVRGKKDADFMWNMSEIAQQVFHPSLVKVVEHGGAHAPPQTTADVKAVVRLMDWAIAQSESIRAQL